MSQIINQMISHVRGASIPTPAPMPETCLPTLALASTYYAHGQLPLALSTLVALPASTHQIASFIILRVRILLAQGYLHLATKVLQDAVGLLETKEATTGRLDAGEEMVRDCWKLWGVMIRWDDEGCVGTTEALKAREMGVAAWKNWLEWTKMEDYGDVHTLLYEIIHLLPVGTLNLPLNEWKNNTDALISTLMDNQKFTSVLAILQIRNRVTDPNDPTFSNIMLEFFSLLNNNPESKLIDVAELKLVEARTRLILYHIYTLHGNEKEAHEKLVEVEECMRADAEISRQLVSEGLAGRGKETQEGRGWDVKWLTKFHKLSTTRLPDADKLAILSSLAHEAGNKGVPDFQVKALSTISLLWLKMGSFPDFLAKERDVLNLSTKFGQPASFWRAHLKGVYENFPPPDHAEAEGFVSDYQTLMEGFRWTSEEDEGTGVVGRGLGLIVWAGMAEMLVGIQELWKSRAAKMVERLEEEQVACGKRVDGDGMSRGLRRLMEGKQH